MIFLYTISEREKEREMSNKLVFDENIVNNKISKEKHNY